MGDAPGCVEVTGRVSDLQYMLSVFAPLLVPCKMVTRSMATLLCGGVRIVFVVVERLFVVETRFHMRGASVSHGLFIFTLTPRPPFADLNLSKYSQIVELHSRTLHRLLR